MSVLEEHREWMGSHDLEFVAGAPVVVTSQVTNVFLDQIVDDALGPERGQSLRAQASEEAWYGLLRGLVDRSGMEEVGARLATATTLFAETGHGRISIEADADGGTAVGRSLHRTMAYREDEASRGEPVEGFTAGFVAAAVEVAHGMPAGSLVADQTACETTGASEARFELRPTGRHVDSRSPRQARVRSVVPSPVSGLAEDRISNLTGAIRARLSGRIGDADGLIRNRRQLLGITPADYYNWLTHRVLATVTSEKPDAAVAARGLFVEAGVMAGFSTLAELAISHVPAPFEATEIVAAVVAAARACGLGRWTVERFAPNELLVLRAPGTHESVFHRCVTPDVPTMQSFCFEGVAIAAVELAHRSRWRQDVAQPAMGRTSDAESFPDLRAEYHRLRGDTPWYAEQSHSIALGDATDRVVLTRVR